jgi:hypothetical protein
MRKKMPVHECRSLKGQVKLETKINVAPSPPPEFLEEQFQQPK